MFMLGGGGGMPMFMFCGGPPYMLYPPPLWLRWMALVSVSLRAISNQSEERKKETKKRK